MDARRTYGAYALASLLHVLALSGIALSSRHRVDAQRSELEFSDTELLIVHEAQRQEAAPGKGGNSVAAVSPSAERARKAGPSTDSSVELDALLDNAFDAPVPTPEAAVVPSADAAHPPSHALKDLGIGQSSVLVLGPELARKTADELARTRLNTSLARGLVETDKLSTTQAEGAVRIALRTAASDLALASTSTLVRVWIGSDGKVSDVALLDSDQDAAAWRAPLAALKGKGMASGAGGTQRPLVLTYEINSELRLASGRSAGTGVSIGAVPVKPKGAADSLEVKVLPPEYALKRPLELDPDNRAQLKQDASPESAVYFEVTLLDTDLDPADGVARAERPVRVRLVQREVR